MRKSKTSSSTKIVVVAAMGTLNVPGHNLPSGREEKKSFKSFGSGHFVRAQLFAHMISRLWLNSGLGWACKVFLLKALGSKEEERLLKKIMLHRPILVWCDLREAVSAGFVATLQNNGIGVCFYDCHSTQLKSMAYYCVDALPTAMPSGELQGEELLEAGQANLTGLNYLFMHHSPFKWKMPRWEIPRDIKNRGVRTYKRNVLVYLGGIEDEQYWQEIVKILRRITSYSFWEKKEMQLAENIYISKKTSLSGGEWEISSGQAGSFSKKNMGRNISLNITLLVSAGVFNAHKQKLLKNFFIEFLKSGNTLAVQPVFNMQLDAKEFEQKSGNLSEALFQIFSNAHLLITHFGITFFQSVEMGLPTLLASPSLVHKQLANNFLPLTAAYDGVYEQVKKLTATISEGLKIGNNQQQLCEVVTALVKKQPRMDVYNKCQLCGSSTQVVARGQQYNWLYCGACKSYCRDNLNLQKIFPLSMPSYGEEYFLREYADSYGKTYAEDEVALKNLASNRKQHIKRLLPSLKQRPTVLDIGAAYGYFLDIMKQANFLTFGVEYSAHAQKIAAKKHNVLHGDVLLLNSNNFYKKFGSSKFSVVTLWYVIEHFEDITSLVEKIASWQPVGGVLGISTPNARGISVRKACASFLASSPTDHYYVYSASGLRAAFAKVGYRLKYVHSRGIHEQRYKKLLTVVSCWLPYSFYCLAARWLQLGDTFDLFFVKTK